MELPGFHRQSTFVKYIKNVSETIDEGSLSPDDKILLAASLVDDAFDGEHDNLKETPAIHRFADSIRQPSCICLFIYVVVIPFLEQPEWCWLDNQCNYNHHYIKTGDNRTMLTGNLPSIPPSLTMPAEALLLVIPCLLCAVQIISMGCSKFTRKVLSWRVVIMTCLLVTVIDLIRCMIAFFMTSDSRDAFFFRVYPLVKPLLLVSTHRSLRSTFTNILNILPVVANLLFIIFMVVLFSSVTVLMLVKDLGVGVDVNGDGSIPGLGSSPSPSPSSSIDATAITGAEDFSHEQALYSSFALYSSGLEAGLMSIHGNSTATGAGKFQSLDTVIKQFMILLTKSNFPAILLPLYAYNRWACLLFIPFIIFAVFFLMSLMLGTIYSHYKLDVQRDFVRFISRRETFLNKAFDLCCDVTNTAAEEAAQRAEMQRESQGNAEKAKALNTTNIDVITKPRIRHESTNHRPQSDSKGEHTHMHKEHTTQTHSGLYGQVSGGVNSVHPHVHRYESSQNGGGARYRLPFVSRAVIRQLLEAFREFEEENLPSDNPLAIRRTQSTPTPHLNQPHNHHHSNAIIECRRLGPGHDNPSKESLAVAFHAQAQREEEREEKRTTFAQKHPKTLDNSSLAQFSVPAVPPSSSSPPTQQGNRGKEAGVSDRQPSINTGINNNVTIDEISHDNFHNTVNSESQTHHLHHKHASNISNNNNSKGSRRNRSRAESGDDIDMDWIMRLLHEDSRKMEMARAQSDPHPHSQTQGNIHTQSNPNHGSDDLSEHLLDGGSSFLNHPSSPPSSSSSSSSSLHKYSSHLLNSVSRSEFLRLCRVLRLKHKQQTHSGDGHVDTTHNNNISFMARMGFFPDSLVACLRRVEHVIMREKWEWYMVIIVCVNVLLLVSALEVWHLFDADPYKENMLLWDKYDFTYVELLFTVTYLIEMSLKILIVGFSIYWYDYRNRFDLIVGVVSFVFEVCIICAPASRPYATILIRYILLARIMRVLRLISNSKRFLLVSRLFSDLLNPIARLLGVLYAILQTYATIGLILYGGMICVNDERLAKVAYGKLGYWSLNMNDFGSSMMTLFVLLVHGWSIILEGFSTVSPWPSIVTTCFFFTFQFISSIVVLNLLMAYILDAFKTQQRQLSQIQYLNSLEQTNRAKDEERKAEGGNVRADHADINADIHADTNCGGGGSGRYGSMMPRSNGKNNSNNSTSDTDKNYSDMPFSYQGNSATYGSSDATHSSSYGHGHGHTYNRGGHSTRGGRGLRLDLRSHSTTHVAIHDSSQDNWVENKQNYFHNLSLKFSQHYRRNHNHP